MWFSLFPPHHQCGDNNPLICVSLGFPCGSVVKAQQERICLPMQETQETRVQSLGGEDPLEEEMATHSSVLVWRIPGTGDPGGLPSLGSYRAGHD